MYIKYSISLIIFLIICYILLKKKESFFFGRRDRRSSRRAARDAAAAARTRAKRAKAAARTREQRAKAAAKLREKQAKDAAKLRAQQVKAATKLREQRAKDAKAAAKLRAKQIHDAAKSLAKEKVRRARELAKQQKEIAKEVKQTAKKDGVKGSDRRQTYRNSKSDIRDKKKETKDDIRTEKKENLGKGKRFKDDEGRAYCPSQLNPRYSNGSITKWNGSQYKWISKCNPNYNFSDDLKKKLKGKSLSEDTMYKSCQAYEKDCKAQLSSEKSKHKFMNYKDLNDVELMYETILKELVDEKGNSFMINKFCDIGCKTYLGEGKIRERKTEYKQCVSKCAGCKAARGISKAFSIAAMITSAIFPVGTMIAGLSMSIGQQIGSNVKGKYGNCNTWKDNILKIRQARLTNEQQWKSKYSGRNAFNYDKRQWNSPNERDGIPAGFCLPKGADKKWCSSGKVILADGKHKYGFHDVNGLYRKEMEPVDLMPNGDLTPNGDLWKYEVRDGKNINYDINPIHNITLEELFLDVFYEVNYIPSISDLNDAEKERKNKIDEIRTEISKKILCINKEKYNIIKIIKEKWDLKDIKFYSYWKNYLHDVNPNIIASKAFKNKVKNHVKKHDIPTQEVINKIDKGNNKFKDSYKCNKENADEGCIDPRKHYKTADILKKREWSANHKQYEGLKALLLNFTTFNYFESFNTDNDYIQKFLIGENRGVDDVKLLEHGGTCQSTSKLYKQDSIDCESNLLSDADQISFEDRGLLGYKTVGTPPFQSRTKKIINKTEVYNRRLGNNISDFTPREVDEYGLDEKFINGKRPAWVSMNEICDQKHEKNSSEWKQCAWNIGDTPCNFSSFNRDLWKCSRGDAFGIPKALGHPIHHFKNNNKKNKKYTGSNIDVEKGTYKELNNYNKTNLGKDKTIRYVTCKKHDGNGNEHYADTSDISRTTNQFTNWSPLCSDKDSCTIQSMAGKELKLSTPFKDWDPIKTNIHLDGSGKHDISMLSECQNAQLYIIGIVNEAYKEEVKKNLYPKMINLIEEYWKHMNFKPYKYNFTGKYYDHHDKTYSPDISGNIDINPIISVKCGEDELGATRNYKCIDGEPIHFSKWGKGKGDGYGQTEISLGNTKWMNNLFSSATTLGSLGTGAAVNAYNLAPQGYSLLSDKANDIWKTVDKIGMSKLVTTLTDQISSKAGIANCEKDDICQTVQDNINNSIESLVKNVPNYHYNYDPNLTEWQNVKPDHYRKVIDGSYEQINEGKEVSFDEYCNA
jgi:hypothetical protein